MFQKGQITYENIRTTTVDEENHLLYTSNNDRISLPEQREQLQLPQEEEAETLLVKKKPFWRIVLRYLPVWIIVGCCWVVGLGLGLLDCSIPTSTFNCVSFYYVDRCEVIGYEFRPYSHSSSPSMSVYFSYLRLSFYNPRIHSKMNCSVGIDFVSTTNITEETHSLQQLYPLHSFVNNLAIEESSNICLGLDAAYPAYNIISMSVFAAGLMFLVIGCWRVYVRKMLEDSKTLPLVDSSTAVVSMVADITIPREAVDRFLIRERNAMDGGNNTDGEQSPFSPHPLLKKDEAGMLPASRNELSHQPTFAVLQKP
jgi:hypothetical protein